MSEQAMWFLSGGLAASAAIFLIACVKVGGLSERAEWRDRVLRFATAAKKLCDVLAEHDDLQDEHIAALANRLDSIECRMDEYDKEA